MHEHDSVGKSSMDHGRAPTEGTSEAWAARRGFGRRSAVWVAVVAYSWWVVSLPPFSGMATAVVLLSGVGVSLAGRARREPHEPRPPSPGAGAWAGLLAVAVAWEVMAYVQHPRADHPTLSSLTNTLLDSHPARAAAFILWLMAMLGLARR